jgi:hypothetical protein
MTGNRFGKQGTERKMAERITELRNRIERSTEERIGLRETLRRQD